MDQKPYDVDVDHYFVWLFDVGLVDCQYDGAVVVATGVAVVARVD